MPREKSFSEPNRCEFAKVMILANLTEGHPSRTGCLFYYIHLEIKQKGKLHYVAKRNMWINNLKRKLEVIYF